MRCPTTCQIGGPGDMVGSVFQAKQDPSSRLRTRFSPKDWLYRTYRAVTRTVSAALTSVLASQMPSWKAFGLIPCRGWFAKEELTFCMKVEARMTKNQCKDGGLVRRQHLQYSHCSHRLQI